MEIIFNGIYNQTILSSLLDSDTVYLGLDFLSDSQNRIRPLRFNAGIIPDRPSIDLSDASSSKPGLMGSFDGVLPQTVVTTVVDYRLSAVELCYMPTVALVDNLRRTIVPDLRPKLSIATRLNLSENKDVASLVQYAGHLDWITFSINDVDDSVKKFFLEYEERIKIPYYIALNGRLTESLPFFKDRLSFRGLQIDVSSFLDKDNLSEAYVKEQADSVLKRFASLV